MFFLLSFTLSPFAFFTPNHHQQDIQLFSLLSSLKLRGMCVNLDSFLESDLVYTSFLMKFKTWKKGKEEFSTYTLRTKTQIKNM